MSETKVAIYCRLSVEDIDKIKKGDDSESIQNQKLLLMDYAMNHKWSIHKVYSDDDYSGLDRNRPEFNKMILDAKAGLFNIVLCKHQSRFTRDMEMVEKYIHGMFFLLGIRFVSVVDNVDTNVKGNKKARQINALMNEWYVEDLSDNIRAVFRKKMEDGQYLGSFAPYGYIKDPNDRHKLVVDEEAANVVREIYLLYLQGHGYQYIKNELSNRGILTPTAYKKASGLNFANPNSYKYSESCGLWAINSIKRILTNKVYIGCLIQGREKKASYKSKKVIVTPQSEWVVIENNHAPLISEKDFYTVQKLIENKRTIHKPKNGYKGSENIEGVYLLAGKVKCLHCGSVMHRGAPTRDGKTFYLRCSLSIKTQRRECVPNYIRISNIVETVESRIRDVIATFLKNKNNIEQLKDSFSNTTLTKKELDSISRELKVIEIKIDEIAKMTTAAYVDKVKGLILESDFITFQKVFDDDLLKLNNQKDKLTCELETIERRMRSHTDISDLVKKYAKFKVLTNEIVNDFVDTVEVSKHEIAIKWLF